MYFFSFWKYALCFIYYKKLPKNTVTFLLEFSC